MEAAVTWTVLWTAFAFILAPLGAWLVGAVSLGLAAISDKGIFAAIGIPLAWFTGVGLFVFFIIRAIIQLIETIQLATGA